MSTTTPARSPVSPGVGGNAQPSRGWLRGRRVGFAVMLPPAILALSLIVNGTFQAKERGKDPTVIANKALADAFSKVPFKVRLPKTVPAGARLVRVFLDEPDSDRGFQAFQLNVWYTTTGDKADGGGRTIHIWQSNDKFLSRTLKDPLRVVGKPEVIGGETWRAVVDDRVGTTYSKRFDDGITMTVDSKDPDLARRAIEELATAQPAVGS